MKNAEKYTILITGGHLAPSLSVIDKILEVRKDWKIIYTGRKYAQEFDNTVSEEFFEITKRKIIFVSLITGRLSRKINISSILSLIKIPIGLVQSIFIILKYRPNAVLSFGSYIALPVIAAAKIFSIPAVTHEQTSGAGLTNRLIKNMVNIICVSQKSSFKYFPKDKTVITGIPIRDIIINPPKDNPLNIDIGKKSVLYIMGGTTGSYSINELIFQIIPELTKEFTVIHQTGRKWIHVAAKYKSQLTKRAQSSYYVFGFLEGISHSFALNSAALILSRSGANTTAEVLVTKKPAIFIPLPWSAGQEQQYNAEALKKKNFAVTADQNNLTPSKLLEKINKVYSNIGYYVDNIKKNSITYNTNASFKIIKILEKLL